MVMGRIYFLTGAAGHLGNALARALVNKGHRVWVFILDGKENHVVGVERVFYGDVCDRASLEAVFTAAMGEKMIFIHCAGMVSITSPYNQRLYDVNVSGTKNAVDLSLQYDIEKFIYVSSVHAIAESRDGRVVLETDHFDPDEVVGHYAKSKAEATRYVLEAVPKGLVLNVVHPSGIIGPYDYGNSHMSAMIIDYYKNRLFAGMVGGYDFVDVRDVAEGIIACCERGTPGSCYILSNQYFTVKNLLELLSILSSKRKIRTYLPLWLVKLTAPLAELYYRILRRPPLYTSYSVYTLTTNTRYSHEKATQELGYKPRDMRQTLADTIEWLKEIKKI